MCPRCRQNAPLVYRGIAAYCTACGAPRTPLTGSSVTLAGQPSKIGGTVARVAGWLALAGGWLLALMAAGIILAVNSAATTPAAVIGGFFAIVGSLFAWFLLRSGKTLQQSGDEAELAMKQQAIFALANTRNGVLEATDVAQSLQIGPKEADDLLTRLAKANPDTVSIDVDDHGRILYRFPSIHFGGLAQMAPNAVPPGTRVRGGAARAAAPRQRVSVPPEAGVRVDARDPLDELEEAEPAGRRARS